MTANLLQQIEKFEAAQASLKQATREANSTLKALRDERRAVEALLKEVQTAASKRAEELIVESTLPELKEFHTQLSEHQREMFEKIQKSFTEHMNLILYGNKNGRGKSVFQDIEHKLVALQLTINNMGQR